MVIFLAFEFNRILPSVLFNIVLASSHPPTLPPVNNTCEPVICPLSFNFNISPTEITPDSTFKPATSPPVNDKADAVTSPLAFTLKLEALINIYVGSSLPPAVGLPLIKKFVDDSASPVIVNPPIAPSLAVTLPDIITLPELSK